MKVFVVSTRLHSQISIRSDECCPPYLGIARSRASAKEIILTYLTTLFQKHLHEDFMTCGSHRLYLYLSADMVSRLTILGFKVTHSQYDALVDDCSVESAIITEQVLEQLSKNPKEFIELFLAPRDCECINEDYPCTYDPSCELDRVASSIQLFRITETDLE